MNAAFAFLVCSWSILGGPPSDPGPGGRTIPEFSWQFDALRRMHFENMRRDREVFEDTARFYEKHAKLYETHQWPEAAERNRRYAQATRARLEEQRRNALISVRTGRLVILDRIEVLELTAASDESAGRIVLAHRLRKAAKGWRAVVQEYDKMERELLEQQPGGITAPAPRPKGTPPSPPKPEKVRD
jgi:hypothetical protein